MSSTLTLNGRLTAPPELRFTASGMAVAAFTIVTSRRVKDQASGEWKDSDTTYWDCKAFKQLAENICGSLDKGMEVVAVGKAAQESWEDKQTGQKRSKISVLIDAIGPSLRTATAKVEKTTAGGSGGYGNGNGQQQARTQQSTPADDPWATAAPAGGGWGGDAEAPF